MAVPGGHHGVIAEVVSLTARVYLVLRGLAIVTHPAPVAVVSQGHYREETALRLLETRVTGGEIISSIYMMIYFRFYPLSALRYGSLLFAYNFNDVAWRDTSKAPVLFFCILFLVS